MFQPAIIPTLAKKMGLTVAKPAQHKQGFHQPVPTFHVKTVVVPNKGKSFV